LISIPWISIPLNSISWVSIQWVAAATIEIGGGTIVGIAAPVPSFGGIEGVPIPACRLAPVAVGGGVVPGIGARGAETICSVGGGAGWRIPRIGTPVPVPIVPIVIGKQFILEGAKGVFKALEGTAFGPAFTHQATVESEQGFLQAADRQFQFGGLLLA
jgi:hypothetical protein